MPTPDDDRARAVRRFGWHTPRVRRLYLLGAIGVGVLLACWPLMGWHLAALCGWNVAAVLFLVASWRVIMRADAATTQALATVQDETRRAAALVILVATLVSLLAVVYTLSVADQREGWERAAFVCGALLTILTSWTTLNTLFTLRYADIHYRSADGGVQIGDPDAHEDPDYRDLAYLAFTVGMCYQVSDQLLRSRRLRRVVLVHAVVAYAYGVVIIAASINVMAGLLG